MTIKDNRIKLTDEENYIFIRQYKLGVIRQLYKERLLTSEQLDRFLDLICK